MSVEIKLEKHPQSDGSLMYSASVFKDNTQLLPTIVADNNRDRCVSKCQKLYEMLSSADLEPEWIALEA